MSCRFRSPLFLFIFFASSHAFANVSVKECFIEASSKLEESYCEILQAGYGNRLPNFYGFKRNPPQTQFLLLKSLADRAGIQLPKISGNTTLTVSPTPTPQAQIGTKPNTETSTPKQSDFTRDVFNNKDTAPKKNDSDLGNCALNKGEIFCANEQYFLTINVPLNRLPEGTLSLRNRLIFPPRFARQTTLQYLSEIYPYYIEKMLLIGLGDSTMSFTKFNALYADAADKGEDFSKRFDDMYELLKIERQSMGIKGRYRDNYPDSIENCMALSDVLIACDNVEQNWVYRKLD